MIEYQSISLIEDKQSIPSIVGIEKNIGIDPL